MKLSVYAATLRFIAGMAAISLCACQSSSPINSFASSLSNSSGASAAAAEKPARLILVGDSTMATRSGYGDALCQTFTSSLTCLNLAKGGRSSGSYRAEGSWEQVQKLLKDNESFAQTYVLIQFGHNDQPGKPGRSTDLVTEFPVNMARYVDEVKATGATPVLVTPLTRRSFRDQVLQNDLRPWAEASIRIAQFRHIPWIDLNAISYRAVQAMGEAEADTLAVAPPDASTAATAVAVGVTVATSADRSKTEPAGAARSAFDRTHVGKKGAAVFSAMVVKELLIVAPSLRADLSSEVKP
ncbi:rhamnogalacturonan acetylesterase [Undibacterium sp. Xuan67W]|uniref:rhamnogalacturonan acetylesterase n=1 Tax=Undibacterium sp. Xuan67W TaxID=3413057 RepID=UPI003BF41C6B